MLPLRILANIMKKKYLFLCLLPLAACQKSADDELPKDQQLMPLASGNFWVYDNKVYNADGTYCCKEEDQRWEVLGKGSQEGFFAFDQAMSDEVFSSADKIIHHMVDPNEVPIEFHRSSTLDTFNVYTYPEPDGFMAKSIAFPGTFTVDTNECLKNEYILYDREGVPSLKEVHYVKPGTGYIRMDTFDWNEMGEWQLDMRSDLLSFELK